MTNPSKEEAFAFPMAGTPAANLMYEPHFGMTLRDYFAAAALTGLLASHNAGHVDSLAEFSYRAADAMLEARK